MNTIISNLRGCGAALTIGLNTALGALPIFFIALLKLVIPIPSWRNRCSQMLSRVVEFWVYINELWLPVPDRIVWNNLDPSSLDDNRSYLVTSNHQTWADIFLVQHLLNGLTPTIRFFLKQELIWIPVIGLCWWALDFPFMKRYSKSYLKRHPEKKGADQQTTMKACQKFRSVPVSLYNFMEGTRFTPEKNKHQNAPYKHLLKPKVGGAGLVLSALGDEIDTLLDITIFYKKGVPGYWDLLCGRNGGATIVVEKKEIPANLRNRDYSNDSSYRSDLLAWINEIWKGKDAMLEEMAAANRPEPEPEPPAEEQAEPPAPEEES